MAPLFAHTKAFPVSDTALSATGNQSTDGPVIEPFFDSATFTFSYVVHDPTTGCAAIIDSVLDYDPASGRTSTSAADRIIAHVKKHQLNVHWQLETHAHADHLSAASYLQKQSGGKIAIGQHIVTVQQTFGKLFNLGAEFRQDGSDFDKLFADGESFQIGNLKVSVLHVPGHTPACVAYAVGDVIFVGDTLFMPDYGTARADFPGGDARLLYHSAKRILSFPPETRLFMCHDYLPEGRTDYRCETTVEEQCAHNVHIHDGVGEQEFVAMRERRDRTLAMPRLILPSVQINIRAGHLPAPEDNGIVYLKIPLNAV